MTVIIKALYPVACRFGWVRGSEPCAEFLTGPAPGLLKRMSPAQTRAGARQLRRRPEGLRRRRAAACLWAEEAFARVITPRSAPPVSPATLEHALRIVDAA
jgi:hypothetical protein